MAKKYTSEEKYLYHKKRKNDKTVSENKRLYSASWCSGFINSDPAYYKRVYGKLINDGIAYGTLSRKQRYDYSGMVNGCEEAIKNPEVAKKYWNDKKHI